MTVRNDFGVTVATPRGTTAAPAPGPTAPPPWQPRSARAAAAAVLSAVDRMTRSRRALETLCAALTPEAFAFHDLVFDRPEGGGCVPFMALRVFGDENVPTPTSTTHRGLAVSVRGDRAIFATRVTHRYRPYSEFDPRRLTLRARALLPRDAAGI